MVNQKYLRCRLSCGRCGQQGRRKVLCPCAATSILCSESLLNQSKRLKLINPKGKNKYYWVIGTNTVIMLVEDSHCILVDYSAYIFKEGKEGILPYVLMQYDYHINRQGNRDYVVRGARQRISYDIQETIYGVQQVNSWKKQGWTVDHGCETYNEKAEHTKYKEVNKNNGSHRVRVEINTHKALNDFLDDVFTSERGHNGVYYDKFSRRKNRRGRKFVF